MSWLGRLFDRNTLERDLDRELRFHIEERTDDLVRAGLPRDEAHRRALIELGGLESTKEEARDARGTRFIEDWWTDTRYALRGMGRTRAFTAAAVLTLAFGIGANTAVWSIIDALMLRSLPVSRPEELYAIRRAGNDPANFRMSAPMIDKMKAALPAGARLAAMSSIARMYITLTDRPEPLLGQLVSGEWFSLLGTGTIRGRPLSPDDNKSMGGGPVAVISTSFWQRRLGGDSAVIGKSIRLNGTPLTIVGVAEPGFDGLTVGTPVDIYVPMAMQHEVKYKGNASSNDADTEKPWIPQAGVEWLTFVVRAPSASSAVALLAASLDVPFRAGLIEQISNRDSAGKVYELRQHVVLDPLAKGFSGLRDQYREPLRMLVVMVALVLLIACANLAALLLARNAARTHEIAIRVSLGARPGRLMRQVITESMTLALIGGAASLVVAKFGTIALLHLASGGARAVPLDTHLSGTVLLFAVSVTLLTGLLFGIAPALRVARTNLHEAFKVGGRVVSGGGGHRLPLGRVLVVSQIGLSLLLVTSAGLFQRTFQNLASIDPGYDRTHVLAARLETRSGGYSYDQLPGLYQRLLIAARGVPGVKSVSLSLNGIATGSARSSGFSVPGRTLKAGENHATENYVSPDFFTTTGLTLLKGRQFTDADRLATSSRTDASSPRVALISEAAARRLFGTTDVIGKRFGYGTPPNIEVVGLVRDAHVTSLRDAPDPIVFYPLAQGPQEYMNSLEVRFTGPTDATAAALRNAIASVDRTLPVREVLTYDALLGRGLVREKMVARLGALFGVLALLLAAIGLYGVMGYSVSRRTNEMGVRLALGASPSEVAWLVLRDSLTTVAVGLAVGLALWYPLLGLTQKLVYGLSPRDPITLSAATAILLTAGAVAGLLPALRAARIDPMEAIRAE